MIEFLGTLAVLLLAAGMFAIYRLYSGPNNLDRILALDYLSIVGIGIVIVLVVKTNESMLLDIGLCLALVGFLTAFIFSKLTPKEKR